MKFIRLGQELVEMSKIPPGLELYTLRDEIHRNYPDTLRKAAEMGYKLVEIPLGIGDMPASEVKKLLDEWGMKAVSVIVSVDALEQDFAKNMEYARGLGAMYMAVYFPKEAFEKGTDIQELVSILKGIAGKMKQYGMRFLYHPHADEFAVRNGRRIIDSLLEGVGTDSMQLELDTYWAKKGGLDPQQALQAYKGIVPLIHVKDMDRYGDFTEVGNGTIDWTAIFPILKDAGVKYYFVEQDESPNPIESIRKSLSYLKSIGAA